MFKHYTTGAIGAGSTHAFGSGITGATGATDMPKGYDLEMISIPKDQFDFNLWKAEVISNFEKAGVSNPEEHFQKYQEAGAIAWNPENQETGILFVMVVEPR